MNTESDTSAVVVDDENLALLNSDHGSDVLVRARSSMSWVMAAGLIINAAIGAGLLNLPKAYDEAGGIFVSSILHAIVVVLVLGAYAILLVCCDSSTQSYETLILMKCGRFWQRAASVCIILYMYGLSITFFIIIGDQLDRMFSFFGLSCVNHWYLSRKYTISISSCLFIFPFCFSKTIKFLRIPSMLGVLAIIYVVIVVPIEYFRTKSSDIHIKTHPDSWTDIFRVLPTMCFCYQAHVNAIPTFVSLKSRSDCVKAILASNLVLISSYCLVALCGYLTFGTKVDHDILMSYAASPLILVAVIMIAIKTFTAYPVNLFCGRTAIDSLSNEATESTIATDQHQPIQRRILIVSLWFFSTLAAAIFLPNISVAIHYLGALAASFIFIYPGLCLFFHTEQLWINSWSNLFSISIAIFYVALGVFVTCLTLIQSFMDDINTKTASTHYIC